MQKHIRAHLLHQIKLEKDGIMYGAGPAAAPGAAEAAFGLIVIRAKDEGQSRPRIADAPIRCTSHGVRDLRALSMDDERGPDQHLRHRFHRSTYRLE